MPETDDRSKRKPTALHWLGSLLLTLGATLAAVFIARQVKETDLGHTYYEFIGGGVLIALVGIGVIVLARLRGR
jgi:hypothetical protein